MVSEDRTDEVLEAIDSVLVEGAVEGDWTVSPDAMRWTPEPPAGECECGGTPHYFGCPATPAQGSRSPNERRIGIEQMAGGTSLEFYGVGLVANPLPYCEAYVVESWSSMASDGGGEAEQVTLLGWMGRYRVLEDTRMAPGDAQVSVDTEVSTARMGGAFRQDVISRRWELRLGPMTPGERSVTLAQFAEAYGVTEPLTPAQPAFTSEQIRQAVSSPPATGNVLPDDICDLLDLPRGTVAPPEEPQERLTFLGIDVAVDPSLPPSVIALRDDHGIRTLIRVDEPGEEERP